MVGGIGCVRILSLILRSGCALIWFRLLRFCSVILLLLLRVSGVLSDPLKIDEEFQKAWLPYFCRSGRRKTNLEEFAHEVGGWLPVLPEVELPRLSGSLLAEVVRKKKVTAGGLDGWGWREFEALPDSWFDGLALFLSCVEEGSRGLA